ncbi:hydroxyisourate hydrolase, partial [Actinomadura logoneensis]
EGPGDGPGPAAPAARLTGGLAPGTYRMRFGSGRYYAARDVRSYYPEITVIFLVTEAGQPHHIPLALGPFGYSTYRGA